MYTPFGPLIAAARLAATSRGSIPETDAMGLWRGVPSMRPLLSPDIISCGKISRDEEKQVMYAEERKRMDIHFSG